MTSFATGTISSAGIGSGLDVNAIVSSLLAVEKVPLTKLQSTAGTLQTKLSAFGQLQSLVASLRDATAPLYNAESYAATSAASSDPSAVSAGSTAKAVPGTYSISVSALSATQTLVSASGQFASGTDAVGTGSITLSLGTWSAGQASFTPKAGATDIVIPIGATENTLAGIRDTINAANAGVSATIVTDASGARLALQSSSAGADNGFRVTTTDDDGTNSDNLGLSRLAFDPPAGASQLALTQAAANTQARINGIAVTTAGNALSDVVGGLSFNLGKVTSAPVTVTVTRNTDAVKNLLTSFVSAYNALNAFISSATKYDPTAKQGALLQGDATTTSLQNQLRATVSQSAGASAVFATLSDIGVEFQKDGTLKLNDTKVANALKNLPELSKALSHVDVAAPANNGLAKKIASWADGLLATGGTLPGKAKSLQSQISANQKDQDRFNDRLAGIEARLRAQYTALDKSQSNANALSKYVTQQIATWNKNTA